MCNDMSDVTNRGFSVGLNETLSNHNFSKKFGGNRLFKVNLLGSVSYIYIYIYTQGS